MGYKFEINWVLKIASNQLKKERDSLVIGDINPFEKDEERLYPLRIPIELVNENWEVLAEVEIMEITIGEGKTKGKYKVLNVPLDKRKSIYSKYS